MSRKVLIVPVVMAITTMFTGAFLMSTVIKAESDSVSVTVDTTCTMTGGSDGESTTDNTFSATIDPGTTSEISGSKLTTVCNDSLGYSIYAIGYSGDSYTAPDNTKLLGTETNTNINTSTTTSGDDSSWSMKLEAVSNLTPPTILNSFNNYHVIPETYTQVAKHESATASPSATGATVRAKYKVYISSIQLADTYIGKVKYTMVHPNNAPTPIVPPAPASSCNTPVPGVTYMQDITSSNKATILGNMTLGNAYYLRDNRDEEPYCVSILADNNLWMLDNLRLGSSTTMALTPDNTNIESDYILPASGTGCFLNSSCTGSDGITTGTGYTVAAINADSKDTTTTNYGNGSGKIGVYYNYCAASAGTYCYASGSGTGNAEHDICPKGWRMPTGGDSGEYNTLYTTGYSSDATNFRNALSTPLSGYYFNSYSNDQRTSGRFWSSTYYNGNSMYCPIFRSNSVDFTNYDGRFVGYSLRCLLGV